MSCSFSSIKAKGENINVADIAKEENINVADIKMKLSEDEKKYEKFIEESGFRKNIKYMLDIYPKEQKNFVIPLDGVENDIERNFIISYIEMRLCYESIIN